MKLAISLILLFTVAANGAEVSSSMASLIQHAMSDVSSPSAMLVIEKDNNANATAVQTPGEVQLAKPSAIIKIGQHVLTIPAGGATRTIDLNLCQATPEQLNSIIKLDAPSGCLTAGATMVAKLGTNTVTRTVSEAGQTLSLDADCPICNNNNAVVSIGTRLLTIPANSETVGLNTLYTNCAPVTVTETLTSIIFQPVPTLSFSNDVTEVEDLIHLLSAHGALAASFSAGTYANFPASPVPSFLNPIYDNESNTTKARVKHKPQEWKIEQQQHREGTRRIVMPQTPDHPEYGVISVLTFSDPTKSPNPHHTDPDVVIAGGQQTDQSLY
ncbi:hypothetical protein INT43_003056 [Umbelopsis isabellina]|uniref:Uncharacterized protein n=1 Tax=Mortierella isabellina TaxID=91625 RepID=A0A8H7PP36_MORIS|nr:hypothetical protein INT43_003056 [Umbelopsis isabellina]